jgi:hypothetical protein
LIIAITYGDNVRRALNHINLMAYNQEYLPRLAASADANFALALRLHLDAEFSTLEDFSARCGVGVSRLQALLTDAEPTGAEVAVVTLPSIGDRDAAEVALAIGRKWKVGRAAEIGDP